MLTDGFPLRALLLAVVGWASREQQRTIESLIEENRVLEEQLGGRRLPLTNDQRRRLAAKGKLLGRRLIGRVSTMGHYGRASSARSTDPRSVPPRPIS